MTKNEYREYLKSDHWKQVRQKRIEMDNYRCYLCDKSMGLNVHHLRYDNLGNEAVNEDLVTLCYKCHKMLHRVINGSKKEYFSFKTANRYGTSEKWVKGTLSALNQKLKSLIVEEFWLRDSAFGGDLSVFGDRMKTGNKLIKIVKIIYPDIGEFNIAEDIKKRLKEADAGKW